MEFLNVIFSEFSEIEFLYVLFSDCSEMEFLNGILSEFSGHKLESSQTRFVWFSNLVFPIYSMNRLEFSCFAGFFVWIVKTRVEYGFL